eukprot:CAMPEP_0119119028 /NCGR_PEP_ID=MMETSP1310-20130426/699_1 /TAXON_ID=464262 /ORGANISM="Genus nov. species nov., Strain RCC2339" /LENGTH=240 /DNA_ID=CAMNT_0007108439 /DNA_START=43 /DNA_END=765 /DNA_ORIENTATION=-
MGDIGSITGGEDGEGLFLPHKMKEFEKLHPGTHSKVVLSLEIVQDAYARYGDRLGVSFNGGKDACVVLELFRLVLAQAGHLRDLHCHPALYYRDDSCFREVDDFVRERRKSVGMRLVKTKSLGMKEGLQEFIDATSCAAILMGTRTGDPHSIGLTPFAETDGDWPRVVRVNPILTWTYADVWCFLRFFQLPYCVLYDNGYTSIGSKGNTERNEDLKQCDGSYLPAYMLQDGSRERHGRRK